MGVVPLLIFFNEAGINTFLDLALDFLQPVPVERDRDDASLASFQLLVSRVQEGFTCQAEWPRNSNHKGEAVVP